MPLPLADRFQALADPTRLRVLALLRLMELSVGELAQVLGQSQPRVSRHLKILADAGVLDRRKEGSWVFLTLAEADRVEPLFALLDGWADAATQALFASDAARTESIRADVRRPPTVISPDTPRSGTRSARCMSRRARSSERSTERLASVRSDGWSTSAPAPDG